MARATTTSAPAGAQSFHPNRAPVIAPEGPESLGDIFHESDVWAIPGRVAEPVEPLPDDFEEAGPERVFVAAV